MAMPQATARDATAHGALPFRTILFDLDGTLTDPKEGITRCMQYALEKLGRNAPTTEELMPYIGPPLQITFAQLLETNDADLVAQTIAGYRERFATVGMFENAVYPGTEAMLAALRAAGLGVILATSKPRVFAVKILEHFNLARYFDAIFGSELDGRLSDKGELIAEILRVQQLDPDATLMVGDRMHDIIGGQRAGVRTAAVAYGYGSRAELEACAPDFIFASPAALADALTGA